jgi:hypothetical protein
VDSGVRRGRSSSPPSCADCKSALAAPESNPVTKTEHAESVVLLSWGRALDAAAKALDAAAEAALARMKTTLASQPASCSTSRKIASL